MPPTRPPYPPELKHRIIELVRAGRSPAELAREFEPTAQTIQNWVRIEGQSFDEFMAQWERCNRGGFSGDLSTKLLPP